CANPDAFSLELNSASAFGNANMITTQGWWRPSLVACARNWAGRHWFIRCVMLATLSANRNETLAVTMESRTLFCGLGDCRHHRRCGDDLDTDAPIRNRRIRQASGAGRKGIISRRKEF